MICVITQADDTFCINFVFFTTALNSKLVYLITVISSMQWILWEYLYTEILSQKNILYLSVSAFFSHIYTKECFPL